MKLSVGLITLPNGIGNSISPHLQQGHHVRWYWRKMLDGLVIKTRTVTTFPVNI